MSWPVAFTALAGTVLGILVTLLIGRHLLREALGREHASIDGAWRERERALQAVVEPLRTALHRTEKQVEALERDRRDAFSSLRTQIESMSRAQSMLQQETRNLVTALRRPEVRGRWGELTLRRVVELAGLSEHCDFIEQAHLSGTAGVVRPDMIVQMPEGRQLVVDAKTPLDAYLDAIDAASEEQRSQALNKHASQVEARVRELAGKSYWAQFEHSPEFAVLFLPGDQFLSAALGARPDLLDHAIRSGVIIATPSTLIALFKTVAHGWRQAAMAENAAEIRDLGQALHGRLMTFVEHLDRSGRALGRAVESYNAAMGSLQRQVLPTARAFRELGATSDPAIAAPEPIEQIVRQLTGERETQP